MGKIRICKKGLSLNIGIIFAGVVVITIILAGFYAAKAISKSLDEKRLNNFILTFSNSIRKSSSLASGSSESVAVSVPSSTQEVCFVDRESTYDEFVKNELNSYAETFKASNLFIKSGSGNGYRGFSSWKFSLDKNPLCIKPINGKISIKLLSNSGRAVLSSGDSQALADCTRILYNGDYENKVDIVFIPLKYHDSKSFMDAAARAIEAFRDIEPFKSGMNKFNFFAVEDFEGLSCTFGNSIKCDNSEIIRIASRCPNDFAVVLADRNYVWNQVNPVRSSTIGEIMKINTADKDDVIVHEFGHAFGNLADEYVYNSYPDFDVRSVPNCDFSGCEKWSAVPDASCEFKGCTQGDYFRPTENSLMRDLNVRYFGPVNANVLDEKLGRYKGD